MHKLWKLAFIIMPIAFANCLISHSVAADKTNIILILGDSLSAEYGISRGSGWVNKLQEKLVQQNFNYEVINASISGETTAGGLRRLPNLIARYNPKLTVIELGGNDALRGLALEDSRKNFRIMIDLLKKNNSKVLLLGMKIPSNYGKKYSEEFESIYSTISQQENISLVRFFMSGLETNAALFQADRIHPNEKAQKFLLNNVWTSIDSILKKQ